MKMFCIFPYYKIKTVVIFEINRKYRISEQIEYDIREQWKYNARKINKIGKMMREKENCNLTISEKYSHHSFLFLFKIIFL